MRLLLRTDGKDLQNSKQAPFSECKMTLLKHSASAVSGVYSLASPAVKFFVIGQVDAALLRLPSPP